MTIISCENLSLQYVISMNWIIRSFDGLEGRALLYGLLLMQRIFGLNMALQWHCGGSHEHVNSHGALYFLVGCC